MTLCALPSFFKQFSSKGIASVMGIYSFQCLKIVNLGGCFQEPSSEIVLWGSLLVKKNDLRKTFSHCACRVALELKTTLLIGTKPGNAQDLVNGVQSLLGEHIVQVSARGWGQCSL